jgi:hypothetical protein
MYLGMSPLLGYRYIARAELSSEDRSGRGANGVEKYVKAKEY